jgi:TRAP-type uncharacterized transport system substrate-binding protein
MPPEILSSEGSSGRKRNPTAKCVKNAFLPLLPGAVRYYREIGISIPDMLVPTN